MGEYNVFISWSGEPSKLFAQFLKIWLPSVINAAVPFCSPDIDKGKRWSIEIKNSLSNCNFGIFCLTNTNMLEPWLLFEAGAISKLKEGHVACILLSEAMKATEVSGPLSQFQHTVPNKEEILSLLKSIRNAIYADISDEILITSFNRAWPEFIETIEKCKNFPKSNSEETPRSTEDKIDEVLSICRSLSSKLQEEFDKNHRDSQLVLDSKPFHMKRKNFK